MAQARQPEAAVAPPIADQLEDLINDPDMGISNLFLKDVLVYIRKLEAELDKD